jgi:hypothetical protein
MHLSSKHSPVFKTILPCFLCPGKHRLNLESVQELRALLFVSPMQALPSGDKRQTLLFSATMTQALIKLQQNALNDAYVYQVRCTLPCDGVSP